MNKKPNTMILLIGLIFLAFGIVSLIYYITVLNSYEKTFATVTSCEMREEYDSDEHLRKVYYTNAEYTVNSETYPAFRKMSEEYSAGQKAVLYYKRSEPSIYCFASDNSSGLVMGIISIITGVLSVIASFSAKVTNTDGPGNTGPDIE